MKQVTTVAGQAFPLNRADVDTDQIIPKQFLKRIERSGFGEFAFFDWKKDPSFITNDQRYAGAPILLAQQNFGCGSSREHAPWALQQYGFKCIIAPSFGDIHYANEIQNGMLPAILPEEHCATLRAQLAALGASLFARGYSVGTAGNISVRLDDGYLITPTDAFWPVKDVMKPILMVCAIALLKWALANGRTVAATAMAANFANFMMKTSARLPHQNTIPLYTLSRPSRMISTCGSQLFLAS